jgi:hypothetical protein
MIYEKLQKCRVELQNLKLKKSGKNNYAGFEYFELKDFLPIVNELFAKNKMFSNFSMTSEIAELEIIDCEDKTSVKFTSPIAELELKGCNKIQALGGTHTYLKRYLYINALEIVEADLFNAVTGKEESQNNELSLEKTVCPKCGKKTTKGALNSWGMCGDCYRASKKEGK